MTRSRKIKDFLANAVTYIATAFSIIMLLWIFSYVFSTGSSAFSLDMLSTNYWSSNYKVELQSGESGTFTSPDNLADDEYFSAKYGIVLKDVTTQSGGATIEIVYIDSDSPLNSSINSISGAGYGNEVIINLKSNMQRITYTMEDGSIGSAGSAKSMTAEETIAAIESSTAISTVQYQTLGGGIRGSLIATLMLIGVTLLLALPIGIFAAIYLHEIAPKNKLTSLVRASIEMLSGVPSIIFGLMGVAVLFPVTALFGIKSTSIILGAMTLSIMLLPVIIRNTEEALIVVPDGYRDGSLSLGATQTQTIFKVILPSALPGILSAVLLSIGRIIGESAALIFTMGTYIMDQPKLQESATSLAVQIWAIMSGENPNFALACAISIIILIIVLILNLSIKIITSMIMKKRSA